MKPIVMNYMLERTAQLITYLRASAYQVNLFDDYEDDYLESPESSTMADEILFMMCSSKMCITKNDNETVFLMIAENEADVVSDWAPSNMYGDKFLNEAMDTYMSDLDINLGGGI
tara:strand:- start:8946 stop:9290 length:345 start_codon:yes stop_codon:yes gene_type:complete